MKNETASYWLKGLSLVEGVEEVEGVEGVEVEDPESAKHESGRLKGLKFLV